MRETFSPKQEWMKEKQAKWEAIRKVVDEIIDTRDEPIDEKVKDAVTGFKALGTETTASCEGHTDHGTGAPWIDFAPPNRPKRIAGEQEVCQKIADKYGLSVEELRSGSHEEAWSEASSELEQKEETPEYQQWRQEAEQMKARVQEILDAFYRERETPEQQRFIIDDEVTGGWFRIHNGGRDYLSWEKELSAEEQQRRAQTLPQYQQELRELTEFLKQKYFAA